MAVTLRDYCSEPISRTCAPSSALVLPTRLVGIEIEMENYPNFPAPHDPLANNIKEYWSIKTDGSLRNRGKEFVSTPLLGEDILSAIKVLDGTVRKYNVEGKSCTFGVRTSVHIHVDVRDLTIKELRSVILMYIILERFIYTSVFPLRESNVFCNPLYSLDDKVFPMKDIVKLCAVHPDSGPATPSAAFARILQSIPRYLGFNLQAITKFSTIEFRHCVGTTSPHILINWINIILGIINAKQITADDFAAVAVTPSTVEDLVTAAYGEEHAHLIREYPNYYKQLLTGVADLQEIIYTGDVAAVLPSVPYSESSYINRRNLLRTGTGADRP